METSGNGYYTQFAEIRGVTVKASDEVDPVALQRAARIIALMLDGRPDIAECISSDWDAGFAIFPKDGFVTDLPEFAFLRGQADMWGQRYSSSEIWGLGGVKGNPVSSATERSLIPDPEYPHGATDVVVHEFAHLLMNLCFTNEDHKAWSNLRDDTIDANLGYGAGLMVNEDEFFAGLTEIYFGIDVDTPKRHLEIFPTGVVEFLEEFYGVLQHVEDDGGYIRYVSSSGVATPWKTLAAVEYRHEELGYVIDLPAGWNVERQGEFYTLLSGPAMEIGITYKPLIEGVDASDELSRLAESDRDEWNRWTDGWDESEVRSFVLETMDGQESYWIRYYGHESPRYCAIDHIHRVLVVSHNERSYGVVLEGAICGGGQAAHIHELESILRSFTP